ncbi:MAG: DNA methyltransferase [Candidatus Bathyarchaeia archaeon]
MREETAIVGDSDFSMDKKGYKEPEKAAATLLNGLSKLIAVPEEGTTYSTHGIHPYAAKFIPQVPAKIIEECVNERHTVLDPFCGSGTTLLEAYIRGIRSIGFDVNPIAVMVSRVKTTKLSKEDWDSIESAVLSIQAKLKAKDYSENWIPRIPKIDHWFHNNISMDLGLIAGELKKIDNVKARNFLEVVFSSIIVSVSNQESETRFAAIDKNLGSDIVQTLFLRKVKSMSKKLKELSSQLENKRVESKVFLADTRTMTKYIPLRSIDLVGTSPPYLNSYDYYLYHKFRIYWLGFDKEVTNVENVKHLELGSRFHYSGTNGRSVDEFRHEMKECFSEIAKVTKLGKLIFVLVGDSIVRKKFIEMDKFYEEICKEIGLPLVAKTSYLLRDITRSFKSQNAALKNSFIKRQHILVFQNLHHLPKPEIKTQGVAVSEKQVSFPTANLVVKEIPKVVMNGTTLRIDNNNVASYTHGMIKYPSKFIPDIPRWAIINYSSDGDRILDPFVGCGTTMVESRLLGRNSIGLDINPLAVLASNVKANPLSGDSLERELERILVRIREIQFTDLPEFPLRDFWFDRRILEKLCKIRAAIFEQNDLDLQGFFLLVLGSIVKPCSFWDESQIKIERDQKKLLQGVPDPEDLFTRKSISAIRGMKRFAAVASPKTYAQSFVCDSTKIPKSAVRYDQTYLLNEFDLVVTSPPYINAINYSMFTRFELFLLNLVNPNSYITHQRDYIGTERVYSCEYERIEDFALGRRSFDDLNQRISKICKLEPKRAYITRRYLDLMAKSMEEIHRVLRPDGKFVFVVGSNTIKGVEIPTFDILRQCAEEIGFHTVNVFSYQIQRHRFKITRHVTGRKINIDNIIVMERE